MSRDPRPELPSNWRWPFLCTGCGQPYPTQGFPYKCPTCGGLFDFAEPLPFAPGPRAQVARRGLARFRSSLPIPPEAPLISLGEGGTPLLEGKVGDLTVHFKCEQQNPTGSFKDRGAAVLVSCLAAGGVRHVVEDSSGNAGSALAAYAARAGIRAEIYAPATASGPKLAQMRACGAEVVTVAGPRSAATEAAHQRAEAELCMPAMPVSRTNWPAWRHWPSRLSSSLATLLARSSAQLGKVRCSWACIGGSKR